MTTQNPNLGTANPDIKTSAARGLAALCMAVVTPWLLAGCKSTTTSGPPVATSPSAAVADDMQAAECNSTKGYFINRQFKPVAGKFVAEFDTRIFEVGHDGSAVGLASRAGDGYGDMGCILMLDKDGTFVVRDSREYKSDLKMAYTPNLLYRVRFEVDVPADRYSVFVAPPGGKEEAVAVNYAFRQSEKDPNEKVVRSKFDHVRLVASGG